MMLRSQPQARVFAKAWARVGICGVLGSWMMQANKLDNFTEECRMNKKYPVRLLFAGLFALAIAYWDPALAQSNTTLEQRIRKITERPEFAHSRFGIKFIAADTGKVVYELNSAQLFVPGSTTKLLTEGTALELFGGDYRFHTKIYRTGPIQKSGTLQRDLRLVSSGDLNLSNRIQADGSLAFEDHDHTYGGPA